MNILAFVKGLLPRIERTTIEEDIRTTLGELEKSGTSQYRIAGEYFRTAKPRSTEFKELETFFYRTVTLKNKGPNFVLDIGFMLGQMKDNLTYIQGLVETLLGRDILNEGLTIKKAHLVRAAGLISFASRYSLDFLDYLYQMEGAALGDQVEYAPAKLKNIKDNYERFFKVLDDYGQDPEKFKKIFSQIPEVVVTSKNADSIKGMFETKDVDPFSSSGMSNFVGNPIYVVRLQIAQWQNDRYAANVDKKKLLELRLLHLKSLQTGKPNPGLEKEISYNQGRVDRLDRQVREVEASVHMED